MPSKKEFYASSVLFRWLLPALILFFSSFIQSQFACAQRPVYHIDVVLDTAARTLSGKLIIAYTNPASYPLDSLAIHLWANAYQDKQSAFAGQLLNLGNLFFNAAKPGQMGGYSGLNFSSTEQHLDFRFDAGGHDIGWIILSNPLSPGQTIHITTPFNLKIPRSFSRMGRTGDSYQFTQWYPHLAVLDEEGWHTMPYLDQGEFFNDFADYHVTVNVPSGYVVASTGMIRDKENADDRAIWNFTAENVIDFAWFANPHFRVEEKKIEIEKGKSFLLSVYIDTLHAGQWDQALVFSERALNFYSDWLGPYPYPHMSVVSAPFSKGGFMEYPMLAQIGATFSATYLDIVITHEIGHTWLYGILADNERATPWMDEGLNTFFERKYTRLHYPDYDESVAPDFLRTPASMPDDEALQHFERFAGRLQPPDSDPQFQTEFQYLFSAYLLPAEGLEMMESKLGEDVMKAMFHQYFADNQFKHVSPVDLRVAFESSCDCDLSWFFNGWLHEAHQVDYKIKSFNARKKELTLVNKGTSNIPVQLSAYLQDKQVMNEWLDGFRGKKQIHLDRRANQVRLFEDQPVVNADWKHNIRSKSPWPDITIIPKIESNTINQLSITPFFAYNQSDGLMLGPVILQGLLPQAHFKFELAPFYGLESHKFRGYGEGRYIADLEESPFDKLVISLSVHHFGYEVDSHYNFRSSFFRLSPSMALRVTPNSKHTHLTQWWKYRWVNIHQRYGHGINYDLKDFDYQSRQYTVQELSYQIRSDYVLRPYTASANIQLGAGFVRLNAKYEQHFTRKSRMGGTWVRGFAGWLPHQDNPKANVLFTLNGLSSYGYYATDYMYDQWLGGRNAESGFFARQVFEKDAFLKTLATNGISDKWMIGGGVRTALPLSFVHIYMDAAFYPSGITEKTEFSYSGGIAFVGLKDFLEIYIPILESKDIRESLSYEVRDIWHKRISFQANFRFVNPVDLVDKLQFGY